MDQMITETSRVYLETESGEVLGFYRRVPQWSLGHDHPRIACCNAKGRLIGVVNSVPEARDLILELHEPKASVVFVEHPFDPTAKVMRI